MTGLPRVTEPMRKGRKAVGLVGQVNAPIVHAMALKEIENGDYVFKNSYGRGKSQVLKSELVRVPIANPSLRREPTNSQSNDIAVDEIFYSIDLVST